MNEFQDSRSENSSQSIRVSPRHLGQMGRPDFCPRCYCYSIGLGFRPPFDMPMPGIMHNLDRFEKLLVQAQFKAKGVAPKWLSSLGCVEPVAFPAKMTMEYPKYGLTLVGMPDEVFSDSDGGIILVDYKSAKCKGDDDPSWPATRRNSSATRSCSSITGLAQSGKLPSSTLRTCLLITRKNPLICSPAMA